MEDLTVCDPPSTLGWVLMAKCFASKLPERIFPEKQRFAGRCEGTGQMATFLPTCHPSRQACSWDLGGEGLVPPRTPPRELLPPRRDWSEGQDSPELSDLLPQGCWAEPSLRASLKVVQAQPGCGDRWAASLAPARALTAS